MNIYDYSNLLTTVRETNVKKIMAESSDQKSCIIAVRIRIKRKLSA